MASSRIAARYSKSLIDLATQNGVVDDVKGDMDVVVEICKSSKELSNLLRNPIVNTKDKKSALNAIFAECSATSLNFIQFLVEKKREAELPLVAEQFISTYDAMKGISRATVVSAIPLSPETLERVKVYVKGMIGSSELELTNEIEPNIIGGMIIKHEDRLLDMSVAKELREIRKELILN